MPYDKAIEQLHQYSFCLEREYVDINQFARLVRWTDIYSDIVESFIP